MKRRETLQEWQRRVAVDIAQAFPLQLEARIRASGNHLASQNDEPELSSAEDPHLAQVISEQEWERADVARDEGKGPKLAARNDAHALDLQVQLQGFIGGLS